MSDRARPSRLSLSRRVRVTLVVVLAVLAVDALVATVAVVDRNRQAAFQADVIDPVAESTTVLSAALIDQETGARGFVITGDEAFLEPFERGRVQESIALGRLRRLLEDHPGLLPDVEAVRTAAEEWRRFAVVPEIEAVRAGDPERARAIVASGAGRDRFDEVRAGLDALRRDLTTLREGTRADADAARVRVSSALFVNVVLGVVATLLVAWFVRRWVTRPIGEIQRAMRAVASGALHQPIPRTGPPELVAVADDADAMRTRILRELEASLRARETVAQSGLVALALRTQLEPSGGTVASVASVAARFRPAEGVVAGDWYDVVRHGPTTVRLALVDVSGHGAEAGVVALRAKQLLLAATSDGLLPGDALGWLAEQLGDTDELFLTCLVVDIDAATGVCRWANAGHPAGILRRGAELVHLGPTGPLLGPVPGRWGTASEVTGPDSFIVAFTDGLVEARNDAGDELGDEVILALIGSMPPSSDVDDVADACLAELAGFSTGRLVDDVTLVVLRPLAPSDVQAETDDTAARSGAVV